MRAGAYGLSLLAVPLNVHVLQALKEEPLSLIDLRRAAGSPPQTTIRAHLKRLTEAGILERHRQDDFPGSLDYALSRSGEELLDVADVLRAWLAFSPAGPLSLGSVAAKSAVKALVDGWSSSIVRALAARPLSLTELNRLISGLNYPSLERRLSAMRLAGQIDVCPGEGRGTPYTADDWLRGAVAPLAVSARWERRRLPSQAPAIGKIDVESIFLLAAPLLRLPPSLSGACRMAVEIRGAGEIAVAGALVRVEEGRIVSCVSRLQGDADAWVAGTPEAWIEAVDKQELGPLEIGGDGELSLALLDAFNDLFARAKERA